MAYTPAGTCARRGGAAAACPAPTSGTSSYETGHPQARDVRRRAAPVLGPCSTPSWVPSWGPATPCNASRIGPRPGRMPHRQGHCSTDRGTVKEPRGPRASAPPLPRRGEAGQTVGVAEGLVRGAARGGGRGGRGPRRRPIGVRATYRRHTLPAAVPIVRHVSTARVGRAVGPVKAISARCCRSRRG